MVGSSQGALALWWTGVESGLAGRVEVSLASTLLWDDLCLQIPNDVAMFSLESLSLGGPLDLNNSDG